MLSFALSLCATTARGQDNSDFTYLHPPGMELPQASFGLGVVIEPGFRVAYLTGQTGPDADGTYSEDFETQARNALASVEALLADANMGWKDVVNINVYLTDTADLPIWGMVRNEVIGTSRPAGTGVIVSALAAPDARVEVKIVAAQKVD
jgi:enamine deaminase RidA (YjgF/YER057c/UK114 family)